MQRNKDLIYYVVILFFFGAAAYYGYKGYEYYRTAEAVKDGNDLLGKIFTPFLLAVIRFIIVMLLGVFVAMNIVAKPLKRIKVMQFEVEFNEVANEIAKVQDKQLNQVHFLSTILKERDYFISKAVHQSDLNAFDGTPISDELDGQEMSYVLIDNPIINRSDNNMYKGVIEEVFSRYEDFFNNDLNINLSIQVLTYGNENDDLFSNPHYNRIANKLSTETDPGKQMIIRQRFFGNTNFLMSFREEYNNRFVVLLESDQHIFTDYDKEVVNSILEFGKWVQDTVSLIPEQ